MIFFLEKILYSNASSNTFSPHLTLISFLLLFLLGSPYICSQPNVLSCIQVISKLIAIRFIHSLKLGESFPPHFPLNPVAPPNKPLGVSGTWNFRLCSSSLRFALHRDGQTVIIARETVKNRDSFRVNLSMVSRWTIYILLKNYCYLSKLESILYYNWKVLESF